MKSRKTYDLYFFLDSENTKHYFNLNFLDVIRLIFENKNLKFKLYESAQEKDQ